VKKIKTFNEYVERQLLSEMAYVTQSNDPFIVEVHSDDHIPPHYHFWPKNKAFELRLYVEEPLKVYRGSERPGISNKDKNTWLGIENYRKALEKWLPLPNKNDPKNTNQQMISVLWNVFHNKPPTYNKKQNLI